MKLKKWASIAEIVGAVAIVVSLIYVGVQVNDSTLAVRSATANETTNAISAWYAAVGTNNQASDTFLRRISNPESLTSAEMAQFMYMTHGLFFQYQGAYYLAEEGTLDTELQQSFVNTLLGVREQPGFALYWRQRGNLFQPSFRAFVNDVLSSGETNTSFETLYRDADSN